MRLGRLSLLADAGQEDTQTYQFLGKRYRERTLRLVYRIADDVMEILSYRGRYDD